MAGAWDQQDLNRQKWSQALQAERTKKAEACDGKALVWLRHHESCLVQEKSAGPGKSGRPGLKVWILSLAAISKHFKTVEPFLLEES